MLDFESHKMMDKQELIEDMKKSKQWIKILAALFFIVTMTVMVLLVTIIVTINTIHSDVIATDSDGDSNSTHLLNLDMNELAARKVARLILNVSHSHLHINITHVYNLNGSFPMSAAQALKKDYEQLLGKKLPPVTPHL